MLVFAFSLLFSFQIIGQFKSVQYIEQQAYPVLPETFVAQVAPQDRRHAQLVRIVERLGRGLLPLFLMDLL